MVPFVSTYIYIVINLLIQAQQNNVLKNISMQIIKKWIFIKIFDNFSYFEQLY